MLRHLTLANLLTLLISTTAWAWGADHPNHPVRSDKWPEGLANLVNADSRVHGYFVNSEDVFFFRGDTAALNEFLKDYAQLPNTRRQLVLHPGKQIVKSPWDKTPRDISAQWKLYATPFERKQIKEGHVEPGPFVTRVDVWLDDQIVLDKLEVPANVPVESSGELEAFVTRHQNH